MHSRPARLSLSALAWIALGAAAFYTVHAQQLIDQRRAALRTFETTARDAADALDDTQAGQQAYLAPGQEAADWIPKVSTYLQTATASVDTLRTSALSQAAGPTLLEASTALTQIARVDRHVREHIAAEDPRSAADAIFGEGADALSSAVSSVDAATAAEQQAADAFEAGQRQLQLYAGAAAAGLAALILALFGLARPARPADATDDAAVEDTSDESLSGLSLRTPLGSAPAAAVSPVSVSQDASSLNTMASVCGGFVRVRDAADLKPLLEQSAGALNARGLIVWLGSTAGADLRPVLAHGYSDSTLARIPTLARTADNAAAAAYRTAEVQVVKGRQGSSQGTIVAPLVTADGCIGALTAEVRDGGELSEPTRALTMILAAQLAGLLSAAADAAAANAPEAQIAAG